MNRNEVGWFVLAAIIAMVILLWIILPAIRSVAATLAAGLY